MIGPPDIIDVPVVNAVDPNDKTGPRGAGATRYVTGRTPLSYEIMFENKPDASAAAQEVVITDQLDASRVDLTTFSLGPIGFGSRQVIPPPGLTQYTADVDLRPANNLIIRINGTLDTATRLVTWRFTSLDPATMLPTEDALAGFLPPNVTSPEGEGSVLFTVMPKAGLATGTEIRNKASIVFDVNAPIETPEWLNTIDNTKPGSSVVPLAVVQRSPSFDVQWAGSDGESGIQDYSVFVSDDGNPYWPWLSNTISATATFTGLPGRSYAFYSTARDAVGNLEDAPAQADATTVVPGAPYTLMVQAFPAAVVANGAASSTITATVTDSLGNYVQDGTPVTLTSSLGSIAPSANTLNGRATALLTSATVTGTAFVTATAGAVTGTVSVDFIPGPLNRIEIAPGGPQTAPIGSSLQFSARGTDAFSNTVPILAFGWEVVPGSGNGIVSQTGQFTGTMAGIARVIASSGGVTGTSGLITVGSLAPYTMTVQAIPSSITANGTATSTITATVTDRYGNYVVDGTTISFTTSLGSIPASSTTLNGKATALLTSATVTGTAVVTATTGAVTGTVSVDFIPGPLNRIEIAPGGPQTAPIGSSLQFSARATDAFSNTVPVLAFGWEVVPGSGNGIVSQTGLFTGTVAGTARVMASSGGITGTSGLITVGPLAAYTVTVQASPSTIVATTA